MEEGKTDEGRKNEGRKAVKESEGKARSWKVAADGVSGRLKMEEKKGEERRCGCSKGGMGGNGWDDDGGRGEEVRKRMRQSYWDGGSGEGGSDEKN